MGAFGIALGLGDLDTDGAHLYRMKARLREVIAVIQATTPETPGPVRVKGNVLTLVGPRSILEDRVNVKRGFLRGDAVDFLAAVALTEEGLHASIIPFSSQTFTHAC